MNDQSNARARQTGPALEAHYQFILWLVPTLERFPRNQWDAEKTAPGGSFSANRWGLHDMHGNVAEWVQDCWNWDYKGAPADGSAWESGDCSERVLRGGSWISEPYSDFSLAICSACRASILLKSRQRRIFGHIVGGEIFRSSTVGFRVVRSF